jgi:DNA-directed RNA polymerase subunit RPC12/RpoP
MEVLWLNRTLDQELHALTRGASLECLACGEFVMRIRQGIACPQCGSQLVLSEASGLEVRTEAG